MRSVGIAALAAAALCGCASKSSEITAAYVSPVQYQSYTCQQLAMEANAVSQRAAVVAGAQDQKRSNDQIATGVAVVVFWPAAFLVGGDGPQAAELANLKGQMVAIEQAAVMKNCAVQNQAEPPPPPPVAARPAKRAPRPAPVSSAPASQSFVARSDAR